MTDVLGSVLDDLGLERAALLVSELATNAVVHARSAFEVVIEADATRVRIGVSDRGPGFVPRRAPAAPDPDAVGGRGLATVERVAARWGVDPMADGTCVWFELDVASTG